LARKRKRQFDTQQVQWDDEELRQRVEERRRASNARRIRKRILSLLAAVAVFFLLVTLFGKDIVRLKAENRALRKQQIALEQQRDELKEELKNANNQEYIREQARKQLRLLNPGEILFTFEDDQAKEEAEFLVRYLSENIPQHLDSIKLPIVYNLSTSSISNGNTLTNMALTFQSVLKAQGYDMIVEVRNNTFSATQLRTLTESNIGLYIIKRPYVPDYQTRMLATGGATEYPADLWFLPVLLPGKLLTRTEMRYWHLHEISPCQSYQYTFLSKHQLWLRIVYFNSNSAFFP
jgi:cell division protein FtsB